MSFIENFDAGAFFDAPRPKTSSAAKQNETVFVQLGQSKTRADIIRDEYAIPGFVIDDSIFDDIIVGPAVVNKVVSQSIAPGTIVAKNTTIDIVLAPPSTVPGRIILDGHLALGEATMESIYNDFVRDDPAVTAVLTRNPDVRRMSDSDRSLIVQAASERDVAVTSDVGQTVENLARTLHLAKTMMET